MGKDRETTQFMNKITAMYPELRRFAYKLTLDMDSANDLVQDCILKVLDNKDKYVYQDNFKGWVFTIMRNIFINNYRHSQRMLNVFNANVPEECLAGITNDESGGSIYDVQLIYEAVENLPEKIKGPFNMFMDGLKYREIAEKCDLPLGTVKSRIFFARKKLQEELRDFV